MAEHAESSRDRPTADDTGETLEDHLTLEDRHLLLEDRRTLVAALGLAAFIAVTSVILFVAEPREADGLDELWSLGVETFTSFADSGGLWQPVIWLVGLFVALLVVVALTPPYKDVQLTGMEASRSRIVGSVRAIAILTVAGLVLQLMIALISWFGGGLLEHSLELLACTALTGIIVSLSSTAPEGLLGPAMTAHHARSAIAYFRDWSSRHRPVWIRGYRRTLWGGVVLVLISTGFLLAESLLTDPAHAGDDRFGPVMLTALTPFAVLLGLWAVICVCSSGFVTAFRHGHSRTEQVVGITMVHLAMSAYLAATLAVAWPSAGAIAAGTGCALFLTGAVGLWSSLRYESPVEESSRRIPALHARRISTLEKQLDRAERKIARATGSAADRPRPVLPRPAEQVDASAMETPGPAHGTPRGVPTQGTDDG